MKFSSSHTMISRLLAAFRANRSGTGPARPRRQRHSGCAAESLETRALLATFTVTNLNDGGAGSLRQAIVDANNQAGADSIQFQDGLTGTISLTTGELMVTDSVAINGPGAAQLAISGNNTQRILMFAGVGARSLSLSGLTLKDGNAGSSRGGALRLFDSFESNDTVNVTGVTFQNNTALAGGAISSVEATLNIASSSFVANSATDNSSGGGAISIQSGVTSIQSTSFTNNSAGIGGAIYNLVFSGANTKDSRLNIQTSTFSGHTATHGGAIYNETQLPGAAAYLTLNNSTVSGNSVTNGGGGIWSNSVVSVNGSTFTGNTATSGGAFFNSSGMATFINSTISGNTARAFGGGLWNLDNATLMLNYTTVVLNRANSDGIGTGVGGGLSEWNASIVAENSIFAGNVRGAVGADVPDDATKDPATSRSAFDTALSFNNLIGDPASAGGLTHDTLGNILGNGAGVLRPLAQIVNPTLANNGGPTLTHALAVGSPAIDRGVAFPDVLVRPTGVVSSTSATDLFNVAGLINTTNLTLANYSTTDDVSYWVTNAPNGGSGNDYFANGTPAPVLTFSLDSVYFLTDVALWGYSVGANNSNNDTKTIKLEFSTDGGTSYFGSLTLHKPKYTLESFVHTLPFGTGIAANNVRMTFLDNWFGEPGSNAGDRIGLDEVRFLQRNLTPATDQRGAPRKFGGTVDIGAVEVFAPALVVDLVTDENDGNFNAGDLSLREAIALSNAASEVATISFAQSLLNAQGMTTLPLTLGELFITSDVSINGPGANLLTVNAQGNSRVFRIGSGNTVTISGLSITGGDATKSGDNEPNYDGIGGGILNEAGRLAVSGVRVFGNSAVYGGAILSTGRSGAAALSVRDSSIDTNTSSGESGLIGGSIENWANEGQATALISNSTISGNLSAGLISWKGSGAAAFSVVHSTIVSNTVGIYLWDTSAFLANSIVAGNTNADVTDDGTSDQLSQASLNNIIGNPGFAGGLTHGANGNIVGNGSGGVLPLSQIVSTTLANNGGPTQTHALVVGSPAIDKGVVIPDVLVKPTGVTSSRAGTDFRPASNLLSDTTITLQNYATTDDVPVSSFGNVWVTNDPNGGSPNDFFTNGTPAPVLTFTLGQVSLLTDVVLWGYSQGLNNDAKTIRLEFSTDGGANYTSQLTLTKPRYSSTKFVDTLPFGTAIPANNVRMTILDNWFGVPGDVAGDRVGLDEVRFLQRNLTPASDQRGGNAGRNRDGDHLAGAVPDIGAFESPGIRVITPNPNAISLRPTFTWTAIAGATSYGIQINNLSTGQASFHVANSATTSYTPATDLAIGKFMMWVRPIFNGTPGNWSAPHTFTNVTLASWTVMPRVRLTSRPTLTWNVQPGAVAYDLWVDNFSTGQKQLIRQEVNGTSFTPVSDLPIGNYRAWVRGKAADGTYGGWSVLYDALVVPGPTPIGPLSGTFDRTPTFSWNPVTGAARYELYVRNLSTNGMVINGQSVAGTSFTPASNLTDGLYRWWTLAVGSAATNGMKSGGAVNTDIFVGGRPTLIAPAAGASTSDRTPTFTWRAVDGAATYNLLVNRTDVAQAGVISQIGLTGTSFTPVSNLAAGTYRAWVRAVSTTGELSPWSLEVNFTITAAEESEELLIESLFASLDLFAASEPQKVPESAPVQTDTGSQRDGEAQPELATRPFDAQGPTEPRGATDEPESCSMCAETGAALQDQKLIPPRTMNAESSSASKGSRVYSTERLNT